MSTGFFKKLDPPHSFPFVTNTRAILGKPIPFSQLPAPSDLSGQISNSIGWKSSFNARAIPDLILWLDAKDNSTFFDNYYKWKDKSDSNYVAKSQYNYHPLKRTIGETSDTDSINYVKVDFYALQIPNFTMGPAFTVFLVAKAAPTTGDAGVAYSGSQFYAINIPNNISQEFNFSILTLKNGVMFYDGVNLNDSQVTGNRWDSLISPDELFIFVIGYNFKPIAEPYRINGVNRYSVDIWGTNNYITYRGISGTINLKGYGKGGLAEFIIYDRSLSISECENVEGYLSSKWGIQSKLPDTHPYKNSIFTY